MVNGEKSYITGQVIIPVKIGHVTKEILFRLIPDLRSVGIISHEMLVSFGMKVDFEKEIW